MKQYVKLTATRKSKKKKTTRNGGWGQQESNPKPGSEKDNTDMPQIRSVKQFLPKAILGAMELTLQQTTKKIER